MGALQRLQNSIQTQYNFVDVYPNYPYKLSILGDILRVIILPFSFHMRAPWGQYFPN